MFCCYSFCTCSVCVVLPLGTFVGMVCCYTSVWLAVLWLDCEVVLVLFVCLVRVTW